MANEAVIVIDVQNAILDIPGMKRPAETHAAFDELVARIATFVERARNRGIPVLLVQHDVNRAIALSEVCRAGRFDRS